MYYEQIEKALECCSKPYTQTESKCKDCPYYDNQPCKSKLFSNTFAYINYLKNTKDRLQKNWNTSVAVQRALWRKKVAQACKDTAKEILQKTYGWDGALDDVIIELAAKYGVEIDK